MSFRRHLKHLTASNLAFAVATVSANIYGALSRQVLTKKVIVSLGGIVWCFNLGQRGLRDFSTIMWPARTFRRARRMFSHPRRRNVSQSQNIPGKGPPAGRARWWPVLLVCAVTSDPRYSFPSGHQHLITTGNMFRDKV